MELIIGPLVIAHVVGFYLTFRFVYQRLLNLYVDIFGNPLEFRELIYAFLGAFVIAVLWPITATAYGIYLALTYKIKPKQED